MAAASSALDARLLDFVANVSRARTLDDLQSRYLDGVSVLVPGFAAGIYLLNPFTHGTEALAARGVSDFFLARYEEYGRRDDPVLNIVLNEHRSVDNDELMGPGEWLDLPVYETVFSLHRMAHLLEAPLMGAEGTIGTLNFGRTSAQGAFTAADHVVVETIARLLGVAVEGIRARDALERDRDKVVAALELCGDALAVTDLQRAERRLNEAARRLLGRVRGGESALDELMAAGRRGGADAHREIPVMLEDGRQALLCGRSASPRPDGSILVSFLALHGIDEGPEAGLAGFGLTRREQDVARLAAAGLHDPEIAERLHLSVHTVKQYLRTAYAKVGARSRVDLARIAVRARHDN